MILETPSDSCSASAFTQCFDTFSPELLQFGTNENDDITDVCKYVQCIEGIKMRTIYSDNITPLNTCNILEME